jgi:hypothetical protein
VAGTESGNRIGARQIRWEGHLDVGAHFGSAMGFLRQLDTAGADIAKVILHGRIPKLRIHGRGIE